MLTEWRTEESRILRRMAYQTEYQAEYQTEYQTILPGAYQMTTEKPTNILPKLPTEIVTEISTKNEPESSSE